MSNRVTRSRSKPQELPRRDQSPTSIPLPSQVSSAPTLKTQAKSVRRLTAQQLGARLRRMPRKELQLLRLKQQKLRERDAQVPTFIKERLQSSTKIDTLLADAAAATLVFAWEAAGTAICISPQGLLLTCSHCIADSEVAYDPTKPRWLLSASGEAVSAICVAWDPLRDLALLQITAALASDFSHVRIAAAPPSIRTALICIGHPGSEDFEADESGVATGYDVLHISEGQYRGLAKGQDPQDNSEIGALKHDCWTYWGHSGAPLVSRESGELIGLHSSWDDETAMRRGIAWEALIAFLDEHTTFDRF